MKPKHILLVIVAVCVVLFSCKKDTTTTGGVKDGDGNTYTEVTIGTQVWLKENLKTSKYNDGTAIPNITDNAVWETLTTPAYCWYNNDAATNKATYGALYNWYAVSPTTNGGKNVCPTGWHLPTDAEWSTLYTYLGGRDIAGSILKETGTLHWLSPNTGADNSSGFTGLPGGSRNYSGSFSSLGLSGGWWSATMDIASAAWTRGLYYNSTGLGRYSYSKKSGFSVRCIKD